MLVSDDKHWKVNDEKPLYLWLTKLRAIPKNMWLTPNMTESFILRELVIVILLVVSAQIWKTYNI